MTTKKNHRIKKNKIKKIAGLLMSALLITSVSPVSFDTPKAAEKLNNPIYDADSDYAEWDCIYFGHYTQDVDYKLEIWQHKPIKWRVLSVDGNDAFLMADECLFASEFVNSNSEVAWNVSKLRKNLAEFETLAFSEEEASCIISTVVKNSANPVYPQWTEQADTTERVYVLSYQEATNPAYGFNSDATKPSKTRRADFTEYAGTVDGLFNSWWLRTVGEILGLTVDVQADGSLNPMGRFILNDSPGITSRYVGVRPVLHLDISNTDIWSYAGKVSTNDVPDAVPTEKPVVVALDTPGVYTTPYPLPVPTAAPVAYDHDDRGADGRNGSSGRDTAAAPGTSAGMNGSDKPSSTKNSSAKNVSGQNVSGQNSAMQNSYDRTEENVASSSASGVSAAKADKVGTLIRKGNLVYKIIKNGSNKQVVLYSIKKSKNNKKKYNVPDEIEYNGATYKVAGINYNVWGKLSSLKIIIRKGDTYSMNLRKNSKAASDNKKVAKVNSKGMIRGIKKGKCTIRISNKSGKKKYSITVVVKNRKKTGQLFIKATASPKPVICGPCTANPKPTVSQQNPTPLPSETPRSTVAPGGPGAPISVSGLVFDRIEPIDNDTSYIYLRKAENAYNDDWLGPFADGVNYLVMKVDNKQLEGHGPGDGLNVIINNDYTTETKGDTKYYNGIKYIRLSFNSKVVHYETPMPTVGPNQHFRS